MIGIVDEYNVLKPDQVYIQYTILIDRDSDDGNENSDEKTKILNDCKVVITKNPCHHPGDIRTFTAVDHPRLKHLKDVVVFSQQGDHPAPHDISGSDLDGDEYLVLWHKDLVPYHTKNAPPYDYDSQTPDKPHDESVTREVINNIVLDIAEEDYIGRLSKLHLAYADKRGVADTLTAELAGFISQEVDSVKTGYHPLNDKEIREWNNRLGNTRPDYMEYANFEPYESNHILGKINKLFFYFLKILFLLN
jgi:RNA-dependent RNA polymerase